MGLKSLSDEAIEWQNLCKSFCLLQETFMTLFCRNIYALLFLRDTISMVLFQRSINLRNSHQLNLCKFSFTLVTNWL